MVIMKKGRLVLMVIVLLAIGVIGMAEETLVIYLHLQQFRVMGPGRGA
jgi:hypothetical protein